MNDQGSLVANANCLCLLNLLFLYSYSKALTRRLWWQIFHPPPPLCRLCVGFLIDCQRQRERSIFFHQCSTTCLSPWTERVRCFIFLWCLTDLWEICIEYGKWEGGGGCPRSLSRINVLCFYLLRLTGSEVLLRSFLCMHRSTNTSSVSQRVPLINNTTSPPRRVILDMLAFWWRLSGAGFN